MLKEMIKTNIGEMPVEDYLDIRARQLGFDDYKELKSQGYSTDIPDNEISPDN